MLPRPPVNGCSECKVSAAGKLQHSKGSINGATNDFLPQEIATVKALADLGSGRTIQMRDGFAHTDLSQYRGGKINKPLRMVASCNAGDMAEFAQGHSKSPLAEGVPHRQTCAFIFDHLF